MTTLRKIFRIGVLLLVSAVTNAEAPPREVIATGTGEVRFSATESASPRTTRGASALERSHHVRVAV